MNRRLLECGRASDRSYCEWAWVWRADRRAKSLMSLNLGGQDLDADSQPAKIHGRLLPHLRRWRDADMACSITSVVHYKGGDGDAVGVAG
jgi:hypothetical protein